MSTKYYALNSLLPFYLAYQLKQNTNSYNLCFSYRLTNEISSVNLIEKLQHLIKSKAHLRQTFHFENNEMVSCIHSGLPAEIHYFSSSIKEIEYLEKTLVKEHHHIDTKSLIKLNIINLSDSNTIIALFNIHHLLMDGYSLDQFVIDLNQLIAEKNIIKESADEYVLRVKNELPLQENNTFDGLSHYMQTIEDITHTIDYRAFSSDTDVCCYNEILPEDIRQQLHSISKQYQISSFNLLLLAWSLFIAKINNQNSTLVQYPLNIRTDPSIAGCWVNNIILPLNLTEKDSYRSLIYLLRGKIPFFKKIGRLKLSHPVNLSQISSFAQSPFAKPNDLVINDQHSSATVYAQI